MEFIWHLGIQRFNNGVPNFDTGRWLARDSWGRGDWELLQPGSISKDWPRAAVCLTLGTVFRQNLFHFLNNWSYESTFKAFNKYHNQSSLTQEDDEQYYLLVREKEDEFSVGSPVGYEHLADGIFIPGAMSHNIMVKPKVNLNTKSQAVLEINCCGSIDSSISQKLQWWKNSVWVPWWLHRWYIS